MDTEGNVAFDRGSIGYLIVLMGEAGLLKVVDTSLFGAQSPQAIVERLTRDGHEFAANARNQTIWNKVKGVVIAKGGSLSFEVSKVMVVETAKSYFMPVSPDTAPSALEVATIPRSTLVWCAR